MTGTFGKKSILLIEDESSLRNAIADILEFEGFSVTHAKNGGEGLDLAFKEHPDLILLDLLMPVMDGFTMLEKLRADEKWGKNAPVILLTNVTEKDRVRDLVDLSTDYLIKSDWIIEDIVKKIRQRIG